MSAETAKPDPMAACCPDMMEEMRSGADQAGMCPMATMCRGWTGKTRFGYFLILSGIALLAGGVLIFLEPRVLVWLLAGTSILIGIGMLMMALFMGRWTTRWRRAG